MPVPVEQIKQALNDLGLQAPHVSTTRLPGNLVTVHVTARCNPNAEPPKVVTVTVTPVADEQPDTMIPQPAKGRTETSPPVGPGSLSPRIKEGTEGGPLGEDDLTLIPGIGPATAAKLRAAGVNSFAHLRTLTDQELLFLLSPASIKRVRAWLSSNP